MSGRYIAYESYIEKRLIQVSILKLNNGNLLIYSAKKRVEMYEKRKIENEIA